MKQKLIKSFLFIFVSVSFIACSKYKNLWEFTQDKREIRRETILGILSDDGIKGVDDHVLNYIDIYLCSDFRFNVERHFEFFKTDSYNVNKVLHKVVPILYYAYSPGNYYSTPSQFKKDVKDFMTDMYQYKYLEKGKFKECLSKEIEKESWIMFPFYHKEDPDFFMNKDNNDYFQYINEGIEVVMVCNHYTYRDFKDLDTPTQGTIINERIKMHIRKKHLNLNDQMLHAVENASSRWESIRYKLMSEPPLSSFPDNTSMDSVFNLIIPRLY
jgi:hypothetical protein